MYNQAQIMDRNRLLGFKTVMLQQNFRKVSILGQISNCHTNKPFPYINKKKLQRVHYLTAQVEKIKLH